MLRVAKDKRAEIDAVVKRFTELHRYCLEDSNYCTSRTKAAERSSSGLSEIAEVPNAPGNAAIADLPLPDQTRRRISYASEHARRSPSLSFKPSSIASSSRHGSHSSFMSVGTPRRMSNLMSQPYSYTDHGSPKSDTVRPIADSSAQTIITSNSVAFDNMNQTQSIEQQARPNSRETITASGSWQGTQLPSSESLPNSIRSSSNWDVNPDRQPRPLMDTNTNNVSQRTATPDNAGNGTIGASQLAKDPIDDAIAIPQSSTESLSAQDPAARRNTKLAPRWKRIFLKLSCY
jgi:hypothetical protein